jgi:hypothetical protein
MRLIRACTAAAIADAIDRFGASSARAARDDISASPTQANAPTHAHARTLRFELAARDILGAIAGTGIVYGAALRQ